MGSRRDYYDILGVPRDADGDTLKRAYRRLARRVHPDMGGDVSGDDFRAAREAFETLSDPEGRRRHDERTGPVACRMASPTDPAFSHVAEGQILLSRDEAALGGLLELDVPFRFVCPECGGGGGWLLACPDCGGLGAVEGAVACTIVVPPGVSEGMILETAIDEPVPVTLRLSVGVGGL
jgi:DnaJ-class molecular chaperone